MQNPERHSAVLAQIEAGMLALLRDASEPDSEFDAVVLRAHVENFRPVIDLEYTRSGYPVAGESL